MTEHRRKVMMPRKQSYGFVHLFLLSLIPGRCHPRFQSGQLAHMWGLYLFVSWPQRRLVNRPGFFLFSTERHKGCGLSSKQLNLMETFQALISTRISYD
ncbi:Cytokine Receptor Common Subunit Gamma [Manis pentadactyla]|nr:Cytokine Receptor Common Subunit Gamma [Manis pentadactyla]